VTDHDAKRAKMMSMLMRLMMKMGYLMRWILLLGCVLADADADADVAAAADFDVYAVAVLHLSIVLQLQLHVVPAYCHFLLVVDFCRLTLAYTDLQLLHQVHYMLLALASV